MRRRKPCKSLFGLELFTLPYKDRGGKVVSCLLTVLNMRDSTLKIIDFPPILKGLKIKQELQYFRRKKKQNNQKYCGHH